LSGVSVLRTIADADIEARQGGLRALVGGGVVEGTEVLVIDLDKCVQCDKCEDACERRHGHSRMNRKRDFQNILLANPSLLPAAANSLRDVWAFAGLARKCPHISRQTSSRRLREVVGENVRQQHRPYGENGINPCEAHLHI
jgi:ferredoxin